ncbi:MAG: putative peptidoglycan glycosyltransferase FtsW [Hyphomicrobiaceae bacterium hypho_1]
MKLSRGDRSLLSEWWFTIDRVQLYAIYVLMFVGLVISIAASPSVATDKGLSALYFVKRHALFSVLGIAIIFLTSLQTPYIIRRIALSLYAISLFALIVVLFCGVQVNGSQRWFFIFGQSLQPTEIVKPAFVVLVGWAFAEAQKRKDMPALPIAIGLYIILAGLIIMQPDVGQTALITIVWGILFFVTGISLIWCINFFIIGLVSMLIGYWNLPYIRYFLDQYLTSLVDERSQIRLAYKSFVDGGFLGRGPGEGIIKITLPDAHTDFIFSVVAEEYGVLTCLALLGLYAFITCRGLSCALIEEDLGIRYGIIGLALIFGCQALINMGGTVGLLPMKGMTLPLISAGGSSIVGISLTLGMLLALSRRRPRLASIE